MKLKQLESHLSQVDAFRKPKIQFEQYPTSAHIASHMLFSAQDQFEDIESHSILDLGVGCGMLSIASMLLGSEYNIGIDIDPDALDQTIQNMNKLDLDVNYIDLVNGNIPGLYSQFKVDTVIMNPPFGTKTQSHIDIYFLEFASKVAETSIYTLHKSSTREFVLKKGKEFGFNGQVMAQLEYDIPQMYKFHKKKSVDVQVDFIRFEKSDDS